MVTEPYESQRQGIEPKDREYFRQRCPVPRNLKVLPEASETNHLTQCPVGP